MIALQALDNAVKFTFDDNQHYLFNGTIEVPLNALTLVTDDSEMATFKKAATNDIFLSCLYSELGMTKSELESFYKENMVGGGTDEEEVQELIDAAVVNFFDGVEYDNQTSRINFKHGSTIKGYIDAAPFIVDGMVSNVEISNGNLVISFNTDAGKQPISIPLTDIFNPNNYYDKNEVDGLLNDKLNISDFQTSLDDIVASISEIDAGMAEDEEVTASALNDLKANKLDVSAYTPTDLSNYYTKSETSGATQISTALNAKADTATTYTKTEVDNAITTSVNEKQFKRRYVGCDVSDTVFLSTDDVVIDGKRVTIMKPMFRGWANNSTNTGLELQNVNLGLYFTTINGKNIFNTTKNGNWITEVIETSAITTSVTSASTDAQVPSAKAVNDKLGGLSLVKLTQSEYDALTEKDSMTLYIIVQDEITCQAPSTATYKTLNESFDKTTPIYAMDGIELAAGQDSYGVIKKADNTMYEIDFHAGNEDNEDDFNECDIRQGGTSIYHSNSLTANFCEIFGEPMYVVTIPSYSDCVDTQCTEYDEESGECISEECTSEETRYEIKGLY